MVRKKKTEAERKEENLKFQIQEKLRMYKSDMPVVRKFGLGERVQVGSLRNAIIGEIIEDGKLYLIEHDAFGRGETGRTKTVFYWYNLYQKNENEPMFSEGYPLHYLNTSLNHLLNSLLVGWLNMEPSYQREYVWEESDKIALIDSIMKQREIGRFIIKKNGYGANDRDEIVDGKQRLNAVYEFMLDKFRYKGLLWSELHPADRSRIKQTGILLCELTEEVTEKEIIKIFIDSNTMGKVMSAEHLDDLRKRYEEMT